MGQPPASGQKLLGRRPPSLPRSRPLERGTARFWIRQEKRFLQALLDYVMVTPDIRARGARWRIWHPLDDPECWQDHALREALVTASDHFPVTLDFEDGPQGCNGAQSC